jgi:AraC-like DNA-binding protein
VNRDLLRLREDRIHGLPDYPVSVYEVTEPDGRTLFDCHWHEEMELMLITEGTIRIQLDMAEYELKPGQAVFVGSGVLHGAFPVDRSGCSLYAVVFHPDFLASRNEDALQQHYLDPIIDRHLILPSVIRGDTQQEQMLIERLRSLIRANLDKQSAYELITKSDLLMIFAILLSHGQAIVAPSRTETQHVERLKQVLSYIQHHYHEPIRLKDLADVLGMSEEHFCRFFKKTMKRSPVSYMNEYRMQQAKILLADSDSKILDIALQVGFDNLSYFITVFKNYCGLTPSQYRKQHA